MSVIRTRGMFTAKNPSLSSRNIQCERFCGAIITAGAMIGLGLTVGVGVRFQNSTLENPNSHMLYGTAWLMVILVVLLLSLIVGLGIAFMGLAFHHERRLREFHLHAGNAGRMQPTA